LDFKDRLTPAVIGRLTMFAFRIKGAHEFNDNLSFVF
jgi:hypothetical protein